MLMGIDPSTVSTQALDFGDCLPMSVISPFRSSNNVFTVVQGVAIPHLSLESLTYRFGLKQNAAQTFSLRGDSIYYIPGAPWIDVRAGGSTSYNFVHGPAIVYHEEGTAIYALNVTWLDTTTNTFKRLLRGVDYTETSSGITLATGVTIPGTATVYITYGNTASRTLDASQNTVASSTKPAAVRAKDIDVYVGIVHGATPTQTLLRGVQSVEVTRRVNLQNDEEFGNAHYVSQDYDTADVSGSLTIRAADSATLISTIQSLSGVNASEIVGPFTSPPIELEIVIHDPTTGTALKTIYVSDAEFTAPPYSGRVQQKLDVQLRWDSAGGNLAIYKGERTWS